MKALLVQHDQDLGASLAQVLHCRGHEPVVCADAESAWRAYQQDHFPLVVTAWRLPGRDGLSLCRQVKEHPHKEGPFVLLLSPAEQLDRLQEALDAGIDDYLPTPFIPAQLNARLAIAERRIEISTRRREVERELEESRSRFRLAAQGTNDGFWYVEANNSGKAEGEAWFMSENPVWYSPRFKSMLGYVDHEFPDVLGSWTALLHPEDRERVFSALSAHLRHRVPYDIEYRLRTKDGGYRWFSARGQATWDSDGRPLRLAGSLRDVTDRYAAAEALRATEARWRSVVENVPDFISILDRDGTIEFINRTAPGLTFQQLLGKNILEFIQPEFQHLMHQALSQVFESGQSAAFENRGIGPNGTTAWYSNRLAPIQLDGHRSAALLVGTDITSRKQVEEDLRKEQRLLRQLVEVHERDRQLVAYEIHDGLVQYMTAAVMHLETLSGLATDLSPEARAQLDTSLELARSAITEARRLIGGLRPPVLDEEGIVAAVAQLVNESRQSIPEIEYLHDTHFDRLDPHLENMIFRIVQEALTNVRRHSESPRARVELKQVDGELVIEVRDWGVGFDPATVREETFGLAGIRERARLLGGTAEIDSAPGCGTRVGVRIPLLLRSSNSG